MPWQIALRAPESAVALAAAVATTLGAQSLWQKLNEKTQPKAAVAVATTAQSNNEIFSKQDFAYIQKNCARGPASLSNPYGVWHSTKECTLPSHGKRSVTLPIDEILYTNNQVTGFKRMLVTGTRRAFFEKHLTSSVTQYDASCAKFGQSIFPILIVAKKDFCDSLTYNQI